MESPEANNVLIVGFEVFHSGGYEEYHLLGYDAV
jgi:hypothetical protein